MVLSVFRSRLRPENEAEFQADGERCSLVELETAEQLRAWRDLPAHREAQRIGRERYYPEYRLQIFEQPARESRFGR